MLLCYYGSNKRTGILGNLSAGTLNRCGTLIRYSRVLLYCIQQKPPFSDVCRTKFISQLNAALPIITPLVAS